MKTTMPSGKYVSYPYGVSLLDRTWPDKTQTRAPVWCSVDLRDGNQALPVPMSVEEKVALFRMLLSTGFKEIEIGFPSSSAVEYAFVRKLIGENLIPDDVTIQVLTQARGHLIEKTFDAIEGAKHVIVHLYNSTSRQQRETVFRMGCEEIKRIAVQGTTLVRKLTDQSGNPGIRFEYSPESFTGTEPRYALDVCHAVMEAWGASSENRIILNLPATVELCMPNVYADRIEWFSRSLANRDACIVSVHTHNDRGTAVAAAEQACLAGADRVEGALFGNGERCGNMDIVTMALNLYTQGIDPELDFSDLPAIRETYGRCTRMGIHPRHPYAGELVYTAFSGSHQDAINKGLKRRRNDPDGPWDVPYLPMDPRDVGCAYEEIVRINGQSGKGGIAYVLERHFGIQVPKWLQSDFGAVVQEVVDREGKELSPEALRTLFLGTYVLQSPMELVSYRSGEEDGRTTMDVTFSCDGMRYACTGVGSGLLDAFVNALNANLSLGCTVESYDEHALGNKTEAEAIAYVSLVTTGDEPSVGVGIDSDIARAVLSAVISAVNRMRAASS